MRASLIQNPELVREILIEVDTQVSEDNSPDPRELPTDVAVPVVGLRGEDGIHGIMTVQPFGVNCLQVKLAFRPEHYGHKDNIELARRGLATWAEITKVPKYVMAIPTEDKSKLRFAQQVGFKREGVLRNSFLRNGKMIDQYLVGVSV